jgi:hypothetical protein
VVYSVWNYGARRYDYYRGGQASSTTHAGTPPSRMGKSPLGATPEQLAWPLPSDAVFCGSGNVARGKIASRPSGLLGLGLGPDGHELPMYLIYAGLMYAAWRFLR